MIDTYAEPRTFATLDKQPMVAFSIMRGKGASDTVVSADVEKAVQALNKAHPNVAAENHRHHDDGGARRLRFDHADAARGRGARDPRRAGLPARLAGDADHRDRAAAVDLSGLLDHGRARLLAQPRQPARHHHRDRHPGRRRHRRDREHRAPHAAWANPPTAQRSKRPTRSASPSSPSPSPSSRCSRRSASWAASPASTSSSSA